ncbi:hypothetical protein AB0G00_23835 [Nocardia salmonicida]|uniref:hypothetical protein n=1 Tax=Nocardia salmonicida TaxID=53431 RepID=UPI0033C3211E
MDGVGDFEGIDKAFKKAAQWAAYSWPGVMTPEDVSQELWVWYLESPSVRAKIAESSTLERTQLASRQAHKIISGYKEADARFSGRVEYSVEDIKNALRGKALSRELMTDLAEGMESLRDRAEGEYFDAIEARYFDKIPTENVNERVRLSRALVALTEETNRLVRAKFDGPRRIYEAAENTGQHRTTGDGPGSKRRVFPEVDNSRSIFDPEMRGMAGLDMYKSWIYPEEFPNERQPVLSNWSPEERADTWQQ